MDYAAEQEMEMEALHAILMDELEGKCVFVANHHVYLKPP